MALLTRAQLNALWLTGYTPSQANYQDWRDSFFHKNDVLPSDVLFYDALADLPATGVAGKLYVVFDVDGEDTYGLRVWYENGYRNPVQDVAGGGTMTAIQIRDALQTLLGADRLLASAIQGLPDAGSFSEYEIGNTDIIYIGQGELNEVTVTVNGSGDMTVNIPDGVSNFSLQVPQSAVGLDGTNALTVQFVFAGVRPFNQSENTMRYPSARIFSRATEGSGGFDVEMLGNNPQRRLLPFATAGRCSHRIAGLDAAGANWTVTYIFD